MKIELDKERLLQINKINGLSYIWHPDDMVPVYLYDVTDSHDYSFYCALIPSCHNEKVLSDIVHDFQPNEGVPYSVKYKKNGREYIRYSRCGSDKGIEPLVICRDFSDSRDNYREICEEFRLFHDLYHDRGTDRYLKVDKKNEQTIAVVEPNCVRIRFREIRQFLAVKNMSLSIQFDCRERSSYSMEELGLNHDSVVNKREYNIIWKRYYGDNGSMNRYRTFSRLQGKRLIFPSREAENDFEGILLDEKREYAEFIIGVNEKGKEIVHTSDPKACKYLTPVHFSPQVLDKYREEAGEYSIENSVLKCGSSWSVSIDDHQPDRVCAWLGDLGQDLPYDEQLHWKTYNISPEGDMSDIFIREQIASHPVMLYYPEQLFKKRYLDLARICDEMLGWQLFLPLGRNDKYYIKGISIPADDEEKSFDTLVLCLSKVLIDAINKKFLKALLPGDRRETVKDGIDLLEAVLAFKKVKGADDHVTFLKKLRKLRSGNIFHRKRFDPVKISKDFEVREGTLQIVFCGILLKALSFTKYLIGIIKSGQLK